MTNRMKELREQQGFTLIELLIVIVVLGILAGIVVFGVGTFRADSQKAACEADVKTVQVANEAYKARNGEYTDVAGLVSANFLQSTPGTTGIATSSTNPGSKAC